MTRKREKQIKAFIKQTANDYCMSVQMVTDIYNKYWGSNGDGFYEKLEELLRERQNSNDM